MKAIVAVDLNWGIGCRGNLLDMIPGDMKFFKETTMGKVVVMGQATFESLPGQNPLKDRINIMLSENGQFSDKNIVVCRSLNELFIELEKYPSDEIFVIGGEMVYRELLPYCSEALVTKLEKTYEADKYFVNLDEEANWRLADKGEPQSHGSLSYSFCRYINCNPITPEIKTE